MSSPLLRYFKVSHLPAGPLRQTSAWFADLACLIDDALPAGPETTTALRKILEAKDAAVRAALDLVTADFTDPDDDPDDDGTDDPDRIITDARLRALR